LLKYYNPVQASDDVVYADGSGKKIPYFNVVDFNVVNRAPGEGEAVAQRLAEINAEFSGKGISVGLIVTKDELYFEKLKRAWHLGKCNDFVIVVATDEAGKLIRNVNILAWDNYSLREEVATAVMSVGAPDPMKILDAARDALARGSSFVRRDFERYSFLQIKIPTSDWVFLLSYQLLFLGYMLWLVDKNPTTKDYRPTAADIAETWKKDGNPPPGMELHPLSPTGVCFFYTSAPLLLFVVWQFIFKILGY
jgi:hypothetical protein